MILALTHGAHERPELLERAAFDRGLALDTVRVDEQGDRLPEPNDYDAVLVMGADQSVYDDRVGWIKPELALVRRAIESAVPVLGVCFGGQLLAYALGGRVARASRPELAWLKLETRDERLVPPGPWLAWHGDAFTLPPGAEKVAWSEVCLHAFTAGPHLGLQFHPEVTPELLGLWFDEADRRGLGAEPQRAALLAEAEMEMADSARRAGLLLDEFLRRSGRMPEAPESP